MAPQRAVKLSLKKPTYAVCVAGVETLVDIHSDVPKGAKNFDVSGSSKLDIFVAYDSTRVTEPAGKAPWPLDTSVEVIVSADKASKDLNDLKVKVAYFGEEGGEALGRSVLLLTCVDVSLDVDTDRVGKVRRSSRDKKTWRWGPEGYGAILLVNCDKDSDNSMGPDLQNSQLMSLEGDPRSAWAHLSQGSPRLPPSQDEMEFGYIEAPHKSFPVVFDSPRNRGLRDFPYKKILGPDFGYVTREILYAGPSGLDSFGNLDVSPPVAVGGREYPLGRILVGDCFPKSAGLRARQVVRDFLRAQQVQAPVELYSDWLSVGHVDEFLSFVPTSDQKGFRLLLASPSACLRLFQEKRDEGHGEAAQFEGLKDQAKRSINDMLADKRLRSDSLYVQRCIDWNREVLKRELGLAEADIVDIPQLFSLQGTRAEAFFPDMVNMVVLGQHLGIPKPYGPLINGRCCLEEEVRALLEPLGLHCVFVDDFLSYHKLLGEVHCGTNVRRQPFPFKWWHMVP
ncbi:protein-arginine deiminase type-1 [Marmota marmota marmota]|uniref:protein-arginine deiminase type-1 n=1 Tax=Marmota marmota marmota TaxID=9994 RepID=UPI00076259D1|nr:protein-arginine deiminase type-1 [Marmota marmota marmota]